MKMANTTETNELVSIFIICLLTIFSSIFLFLLTVNRGADPETCYGCQMDFIKTLVEMGADLNVKDYEGKTPLDTAKFWGKCAK